VQVYLSVLYGESVFVVSYNHLNKFDDRLARLGGELNVVYVKLVVEFVVGAIIIRFFRCT
jgi:hypothetical protein